MNEERHEETEFREYFLFFSLIMRVSNNAHHMGKETELTAIKGM
jgi:hypothetical protein